MDNIKKVERTYNIDSFCDELVGEFLKSRKGKESDAGFLIYNAPTLLLGKFRNSLLECINKNGKEFSVNFSPYINPDRLPELVDNGFYAVDIGYFINKGYFKI
ncbi:MAG TPA: hypothetical protein P5277_03685 [Candidatus Paceibacterota bacterium]|nr:hypothetical protein [Candidatus Paceibacterota bacterium]